MKTDFLFIIDVQRYFINEHTAHIPARVEALQQAFDEVCIFRFLTAENSPHHKIKGWHRGMEDGSTAAQLMFTPAAHARQFTKIKYSAFSSKELMHHLCHHLVGTIYFAGVNTDACIMKSALDCFERGVRPVVLADYCASHRGEAYHHQALDMLRSLIGESQVISGDLLSRKSDQGPVGAKAHRG